MKREPTISIGAISAAVAAVLTLITAFGVELTEEQTTAILGVIAAVGPIVTSLVIRRKVPSGTGERR